MPHSVKIQGVIEAVNFPPTRKGEAALARVTFTMPVRENRDLVVDLVMQRGNAVDLEITPLQIALPDEAPESPTPLRQRRGRGRNGASAETPPDPADIPHEYQAPTSVPGGDCVICGEGPNTDKHAEGQTAGELSPEAQGLIDSIPPADA